MPPPRRNDPCPCGSGLKFKRCHGRLTVQQGGLAAASATGSPPTTYEFPTPRTEVRWEVDLLPLPIALEDNPDARPVMLMVMGDGQVLQQEMLNPPPSDTPGIATVMLQHLRVVVDRVGFWPPVVAVRTAEVRDAVRAAAGAVPCRFEAGPLPEFEDASRSLLAFLSPGMEDRPLGLSAPETWKGWGLPTGQIAELFDAAAAYAKARPWRRIANEDLLLANCPTGNQWTVCVLGNGGVEFGLALYRDPEDLERQFMAVDPRQAMADLRGPVLSLTYSRRDDLPKVMRKEVLAAGWTVAGPEFYPALLALNTPGGGITATQLADLRDILRALGPFARKFDAEFASPSLEAISWRDPETDVMLSRHIAPELDSPLWPLPAVLNRCTPEGPRAEPAAALEDHNPAALRLAAEGLLARFHQTLNKEYARATADKHGINAGLLIAFLTEVEGIPIEAMTEYDLRVFLFDWMHRAVTAPKAVVRAMPVSLKRFFRFLDADCGLEYPWAWAILADQEAFQIRQETWPGAFEDERAIAAWIMELTLDLEARMFLPALEMANGREWGDMMGKDEQALHRELRRRWVLWRDEVIAAGQGLPGEIWEELVRRQRDWELAPHPAFRGRAPVEVVRREREACARNGD